MNYYSSDDMLTLVAQANYVQLPKLITEMTRATAKTIPWNRSEEQNLLFLRTLHQKYLKGRFEHTDADELRLKASLDWIVNKMAELKAHPGNRDFPWNAAALRKSEPLSAGAYREAIQRMADGNIAKHG